MYSEHEGDQPELSNLEVVTLRFQTTTTHKEKTMDKMVVVVFDNESKADEGCRALVNLHNENSLTVYGRYR